MLIMNVFPTKLTQHHVHLRAAIGSWHLSNKETKRMKHAGREEAFKEMSYRKKLAVCKNVKEVVFFSAG